MHGMLCQELRLLSCYEGVCATEKLCYGMQRAAKQTRKKKESSMQEGRLGVLHEL